MGDGNKMKVKFFGVMKLRLVTEIFRHYRMLPIYMVDMKIKCHLFPTKHVLKEKNKKLFNLVL